MKKKPLSLMIALFFVLIFAHAAGAQSTSFSYQGSVQSGGSPASGNHDFEFALFDAPAAGTQIGSVLSINNVAISNGIFSVQLDFGNQFPGANRFLEIRVRPTGQPGMTVLAPRQLLRSAPYSVKSLTAETATNAAQLGGVAANQFVVTTDPRMSDARTPVAGSGDYIQNRTTEQPATNFSISGNGTIGGSLNANIVRAMMQFNIGGNRILSTPGVANTFVGERSGFSNTSGSSNSFFGTLAGSENTSGGGNAFFGANSGFSNTTGLANSFFGVSSGQNTTTGATNSFFGAFAGTANTTGTSNSYFGYRSGNHSTGSANSFFGRDAGYQNTTGSSNSFFGTNAGVSNTTGVSNAFFGANAGESNTTGLNNAFFGVNAGAANTTALGNSFFGANAGAANTTAMGNSFFGASAGLVNIGINNSFFGTVAGVANTTASTNSFFGHWAGHDTNTGGENSFFGAFAGESNTIGSGNVFIGKWAGQDNLTGTGNTFVGRSAGELSTGSFNTFVGYGTGGGNSGANNTLLGHDAELASSNLNFATAIGAGANVINSNQIQLGRDGVDTVRIGEVGGSGSTHLCLVSNTLALCSSSLRYKQNVQPLSSGLDLIARLRPVLFEWRDRNETDLGLIAEEVAEVEPLLVTRRKSGMIEGVKYDQLTVVLINAVNEQQAHIQAQAEVIKRQQRQIDALTKIVCATNAAAEICKEKQ